MHTSLKMLDAAEGRVGGYLIVWGSPAQRDLQGEYFTPQTDLGLEWYERRPALYHHGLDGDLGPAVIGVIDTLKADTTGVWAEAQLNLRRRYVRTVLRLIEEGALGWSSGSLPHLVEVAQDGRIKRWIIVEGSLTPTPAEPRRTNVSALKSAYQALGLDASRLKINEAPDLISGERDSAARLSPSPRAAWERGLGGEVSQQRLSKGKSMNDNPNTYDDSPRKRLPNSAFNEREAAPRISVASPFDNLDALDMLHGYVLMRATKHFQGASEQYSNALAHKLHRTGVTALKADELSYSTQTAYGDEWVPDLWSAELWRRARLDNVILPLFRSVEMPSNPFELPAEAADPSVYFVPETTDENQLTLGSANPIPDSKIGSGKLTLAAKKLALRVGFSAELVEDAIIPVLNMYREQAQRAISDSIDYVLLNGDTAQTTANINKNGAGATFSGTERYLAFNGLRKLPLITNTANRSDSTASALDLAKLRTTRFLMDKTYAARPSDLAWIVDSGTYAKLLGLSEFLTMEKAGTLATAQTGQIGYVDGAPVLVSAEMPLTNASGVVDHPTPANNTRGTALCVYRPGWMVGYRRRIAASVDYLPYHDAYQMTATVRLAFVAFDNEVASALYNIAI